MLSAELIKRLFEMEVPEIYDDTVVIKSAVREPGDRAKIAVTSNEKDVDPVGACVGMKGSRVQSIIKELRGEKIDIIEWSDEPSVFAANALSPAKVSQVRITDINKRKMEVIVGEDQLSLAIGKKGQNVRLATRLVGWDIDIVSEEVLKKEIAQQMGRMMASGEAVPITALEGVSTESGGDSCEKGIDGCRITCGDDRSTTWSISLTSVSTRPSEFSAAAKGDRGGQECGDRAVGPGRGSGRNGRSRRVRNRQDEAAVEPAGTTECRGIGSVRSRPAEDDGGCRAADDATHDRIDEAEPTRKTRLRTKIA